MPDTTPPTTLTTPPADAPAPIEVKRDSPEDLVNRVARIEAQLNINPDVE